MAEIPDWKRLASHAISRRVSLGYQHRRAFAAAIKVTDRTLTKLEEGQPVGRNTLAAVEVGLRWKPGSVDALLEGGEPTLAGEDFDGCSRDCRKAGAHTLEWGRCEHAVEPEPRISLGRTIIAPDGFPSIVIRSVPVSELADRIEKALRTVNVTLSDSEYAALALAAVRALSHNEET